MQDNPGIKIRVLDNLSVGQKDDLSRVCMFSETTVADGDPSQVTLIVGDIRDFSLSSKCCRDIDVIVHLAANTGVGPSVKNPRTDMETNVLGTFNILEAARENKVKRFVFASSGAPIGEVEPPIHEEIAPHPVSPYGASKLAGEGYCSVYYRTFGIETVVLRFGNVYGPGSGHKGSVIAKFIGNAIAEKPIEIYGDGKQTRDFIYIDDLARAILLGSIKRDIGGETFQIASNTETSVAELVDRILPILRKKGIKNLAVVNTDKRKGDVKRNYSDTSKAKKLLGWESQTSLSKGLEQTATWFTNQ